MVADTSSPLMPEKLDLMVRRLIWLKAPKAPRHISQFSHEIIWIDLPEIPCFRLHSSFQSKGGFINSILGLCAHCPYDWIPEARGLDHR